MNIELQRSLIIYGFPSFALIDSLLVWIARRRGIVDEIGLSPGWYAFHYKYGILRVNICKILLFCFLGFPPFYTNGGSYGGPAYAISFLLSIHVIKSAYYLIKHPKVDKHE